MFKQSIDNKNVKTLSKPEDQFCIWLYGRSKVDIYSNVNSSIYLYRWYVPCFKTDELKF